MEPLRQLNLAMQYIESHLAEELDIQKVAQLAGCSEYHFRRMFSFLSGMSLSEYIRCRRLSQTAGRFSTPCGITVVGLLCTPVWSSPFCLPFSPLLRLFPFPQKPNRRRGVTGPASFFH